MALARIITLSEACSRELAADLLSRGYTVEVVAPDAVPTHKADLELRVEAKSGERLTANVVVRDGERSTSLDFVRDLSAPAMCPIPSSSSAANSVPAYSDSAAPAASGSAVASTASARVDPRDDASVRAVTKPDANFDDQDSLFPMSALNRWNSPPDVSAVGMAIASSRIARPAITPPITRRPAFASSVSDRPVLDQTEFNRAVLNQHPLGKVSPAPEVKKRPKTPLRPLLAAIMQQHFSERISSRLGIIVASMASLCLLLGIVLGFRSGRTEAAAPIANAPAAVVSSPSAPAVASPATTVAKSSAAVRTSHAPESKRIAAKPVIIAKATAPKLAVQQSKVFVGKKSAASAKDLQKHTDDLIARDTVTYLDRPAKKATAKVSGAAPRTRTRHSGEIAENTVIYLNGMTAPSARPSPKPTK